MNKWDFIKVIWQRPIDPLPRRIYADWLDEHNMCKAARKQREFARIIEQSHYMFYIPYVEQIWGEIKNQYFRMKKDGFIRLQPRDFTYYWSTLSQKHVLKGKPSPRTLDPIDIERLKDSISIGEFSKYVLTKYGEPGLIKKDDYA